MFECIPLTPDACYRMWNEECDIPEGLCEVCSCADLPVSDIRSCPCGKRLRNAYRGKMERATVVVTGSRFYQPPQECGQIEQIVEFPMLVMEE